MSRGISISGGARAQWGAVVVAAGSGVRMGAGVPKALMTFSARPLLNWCLDALTACDRVGPIVVVGPPGRRSEVVVALGPAAERVSVVDGGASRAESVAIGLDALPDDLAVVVVHDAARPLVTPELVEHVVASIGDADGAIAAAPLADTPKRVDESGTVVETPARQGLWLAQTPQAFRAGVLREANGRARSECRLDAATDCSSLVEAIGGTVRVAPWPHPNLKVTTPADIAVGEALLARVAGVPRPGVVG